MNKVTSGQQLMRIGMMLKPIPRFAIANIQVYCAMF